MTRTSSTRCLLAAALILFGIAAAACGDNGAPKVDPMLQAANDAYSQGLYLEAETAYERYLQDRPQGTSRELAWTRLLEIAQDVKDDPVKAASLLEAMVLEFGRDETKAFRMLSSLGGLYARQGDTAKALHSWERALELGVDDPDGVAHIYLQMARLYRRKGQYDLLAEVLLDGSTTATTPSLRAKCLYELAQAFSINQNWPQVIKYLGQIMTMKDVDEEQHSLAVYLLAEAYEHEHHIAKARELLQSIRETYPNPLVIEARLKGLPPDENATSNQ